MQNMMLLAMAITDAPMTADKRGQGRSGASGLQIFSKRLKKKVVRVDPIKVLKAISFPRTINASSKRKQLIHTRMVSLENGRYALRITEIPLVPPSSRESGKIKRIVAKAYKILPSTMKM